MSDTRLSVDDMRQQFAGAIRNTTGEVQADVRELQRQYFDGELNQSQALAELQDLAKIEGLASGSPRESATELEERDQEKTMRDNDKPQKVGGRSFADIAQTLYGKSAEEEPVEASAREEEPAGEEKPSHTEKKGKAVGSRSLEELGEIIYPAKQPRFARVTETGQVASVIRDREGFIIHGAEGGGHYSDIRDMIAYYAPYCGNADLSGIDFGTRELRDVQFSGGDLSGSSFHGRLEGRLVNANCRGTSFRGCNFGFSDLRGAEFDSQTDITGADFTNARYRLEDVKKCKGWRQAKGLRMGREKD